MSFLFYSLADPSIANSFRQIKNVLRCSEIHANPFVPENMPTPTLWLRQFLKDGILRYPVWLNHKSPQNTLLEAALASEILSGKKFWFCRGPGKHSLYLFVRNHLQKPQTQLGHPSRVAHIDSCPGGRCLR
jgi:hypothetical protein